MKGTQSIESTKNPEHPVISASQYYHPLIWTNGSARHRNSPTAETGREEGEDRSRGNHKMFRFLL